VPSLNPIHFFKPGLSKAKIIFLKNKLFKHLIFNQNRFITLMMLNYFLKVKSSDYHKRNAFILCLIKMFGNLAKKQELELCFLFTNRSFPCKVSEKVKVRFLDLHFFQFIFGIYNHMLIIFACKNFGKLLRENIFTLFSYKTLNKLS